MAQQLGMMRVRGKLGNVVGFTNSASEKTNNNFYRERATTVSNPKTQKQATQRSKVKPAAAFYSAFESILNHAFLPSQRPVKNRNKFMRKAMQLNAVPDVRKDDNYLPVLPYQVSEGNLGLDYLTVPTQDVAVPASLNFGFGISSLDMSVAQYSAAVLASHGELENGEELTFMAVICSNNDPYVRRTAHCSIILDTSNTVTKIGDITTGTGLRIDVDGQITATTDFQLLGAALVISSKTSSSWRYTKSFFYLTAYAKSLPNITNEVVLSYMSAEAQKTSDLILQQADNEATNGAVRYVGIVNIEVANATGQEGTFSPANATMAVNSLGVRVPVVEIVDGEPCLLHKKGPLNWVKVKRSNGDVEANVPLSTTTWAGSDYIELWVLQESWPELTD